MLQRAVAAAAMPVVSGCGPWRPPDRCCPLYLGPRRGPIQGAATGPDPASPILAKFRLCSPVRVLVPLDMGAGRGLNPSGWFWNEQWPDSSRALFLFAVLVHPYSGAFGCHNSLFATDGRERPRADRPIVWAFHDCTVTDTELEILCTGPCRVSRTRGQNSGRERNEAYAFAPHTASFLAASVAAFKTLTSSIGKRQLVPAYPQPLGSARARAHTPFPRLSAAKPTLFLCHPPHGRTLSDFSAS